ncbi:MAG: EAL domain-containing protein [Rhodocyclaceae bacterium]|nr:EAL domain-containing protein [Rhodocyclaceae bacterium]
MPLHRLLQRQLKRLAIAEATPPADAAQWREFIERVSRAYVEADQERYLLERSQDVSSHEMQELYAQVQEAQRIAGLGNWSYDRVANHARCSVECLRLLGYAADAPAPGWRQVLAIVHPRDRRRLGLAVRRAFREGVEFDIEFRLVPPPFNRTRWVRVRAEPRRDGSGRVVRLHGTTTDVSDRKTVETRQSMEYAVTRLLAETDEVDVALTRGIRLIGEALEATCTRLWMLGGDGQRLAPVAEVAPVLHAERVEAVGPCGLRDAPEPEHEVADALRLERVMWISAHNSTDALCSRCSSILVPLCTAGQKFGVMQFFAHSLASGDVTQQRSLQFVGRLIGMFLRRRKAEQALRESEAHFRALVEHASDSLFVHDVRGRLVDVNERSCTSLGYSREELLALRIQDVDALFARHNLDGLRARLRKEGAASLESRYRRKDGSTFPVEISIASIDFNGRPHLLSLVRDVTERHELQARLSHLAYHDALTGLPNRTSFNEQLLRAIARARRRRQRLALMFLDLDRFKNVNDILGHEAGDELLRQMGARLAACLRKEDMVARISGYADVIARFGGDEFVLLIEDVRDPSEVVHVARKVLRTLVAECCIEGQSIHVTASIGIALFPEDGDDGRTLMRHADAAMYRAKMRGKDGYEFYSAQMEADASDALMLESSLRAALVKGELTLHYQPRIDLASLRVTGVEALMRWNHPHFGLLMPGRFIPVAEETGLIVPMTAWLLREACSQLQRWREAGHPPLCMAVNLSARQFADDHMLDAILEALRLTGVPPDWLELEITESMVMGDPERAIRVLARLREVGVRVAIDDFGTGYSSLSQLGRLPVNVLKIDRAFIKDLPGDGTEAAITRAIIAMGQGLGMSVVAEGVETSSQLEFLLQHGCAEAQGFYFARPMPAGELEAHLAMRKRAR